MDLTAGQLALLALAGVAAGVVNAVVGSGTLITYPALIAVGVPPVVANGTNTTGLFPGSFSATWPYRDQLRARWRRLAPLAVVSFVFAIGGALLVIVLPPSVFATAVPWLIGVAVVLVAVQPWLSRRLSARDVARADRDGPPGPGLLAAVSATGTYGGYFGAAQGVMLMAVLGLLDDTDPRRANGVKNLLASMANVAAALVFVVTGRVVWPAVLAIAAGAVVGGYVGGHGARRLPAWALRSAVVVVGLVAAVTLLRRG